MSLLYEKLLEVVVSQAEQIYKGRLERPADLGEAKEQKELVLKQRRQLRSHAIALTGERDLLPHRRREAKVELLRAWGLVAKLLKCTRRLKDITKKERQDMGKLRCQECNEAYRERDAAKAYRLARMLSGRRIGPKRRRYDIPAKYQPDKEEWLEFLAGPGPKGGIAGQYVDWQQRSTMRCSLQPVV